MTSTSFEFYHANQRYRNRMIFLSFFTKLYNLSNPNSSFEWSIPNQITHYVYFLKTSNQAQTKLFSIINSTLSKLYLTQKWDIWNFTTKLGQRYTQSTIYSKSGCVSFEIIITCTNFFYHSSDCFKCMIFLLV